MKTPLEIDCLNNTGETVTLLVVSAPDGASTDGASISYGHKGTPVGLNATLYDTAGTAIANYSSNRGFDSVVLLTKGMTLVIKPASGLTYPNDVITIESLIGTFGSATVEVP